VRFEWSKQKAESNLRKHSVSFEEAATVFDDPLVQLGVDWEHGEPREVALGVSNRQRVLFTVWVELRDDVIRIISARKAAAHERQRYEEG
jgi:uncharacterized DUF497 family protein